MSFTVRSPKFSPVTRSKTDMPASIRVPNTDRGGIPARHSAQGVQRPLWKRCEIPKEHTPMFANIAQPNVQFAAPAIRSGAQDAIRCLSATTVLTGVVAGIGVIGLA